MSALRGVTALRGAGALRVAPIAAAGLFLAAFPLVSDDRFYQNMIILSLVFAIGAVGLNVIMGYGGYVSLGQSAFVGLGAYTVALLSLRVGGNPFIWVPVAGLVAAVFAALLGVIAMRTRGHAFVIITIAFLFLMQLVAVNVDTLTNGTSGSRCRSRRGAPTSSTGRSTTPCWRCSSPRWRSRGGSADRSSAWA